MADKADLIKQLFDLCNGRRNMEVWLDARGEQLKTEFAGDEAIKRHFVAMGMQKYAAWQNIVVEIYSPRINEDELNYAIAEMTKFRAAGITDPTNKQLPARLAGIMKRMMRLQPELDARMHQFLPNLLITAVTTYQARN